MNRNINLSLVALGVLAAFMTSACESQIPDVDSSTDAGTKLEVRVKGLVSDTRSVIVGDTLPNFSNFGVYAVNTETSGFVENCFNIEANYTNGKSTLSQDVIINFNENWNVYAVFPYNKLDYPTKMQVETATQTDYLWGRSIGVVNESHPKAEIQFGHILSRITLRFHRSSDNSSEYSIGSVSFEGDGENQFRNGYVDLIERKFVAKNYGSFQPINASLSANKLDSDNNLIIAELLVIPAKTRWSLCLEISGNKQYFWDVLPETDYLSGKQYIYDCEINTGGELVISNCEIQPWVTEEMPEVETY